MQRPQAARPRARSAFAAAFLSLIFPGLGHAYAGAWERAIGFAAAPLLVLSLSAGIALSLRLELLGFLLQPVVLSSILIVNVVFLLYRLVAAVDAYRVTVFLTAMEASGGGRLGRPRTQLSLVSLAGLLAVLLVMAGGHAAVAYYDLQAYDLVNCVFDDSGQAAARRPRKPARPDAGAGPPEPTVSAPATPLRPNQLGWHLRPGTAGPSQRAPHQRGSAPQGARSTRH
jgi:hypothetical protein